MEASKIDFLKLAYRSANKKYFNFNEFVPLSSDYLKLEFEEQINKLRVKKARTKPYKTNRNVVIENAEALYNGVKIVMDAFENLTFLTRYHPNVDISSDSESELESKIE